MSELLKLSPILLRPSPLTEEEFAPYGEVIEASATPIIINDGQTARFHDLITLDAGNNGKPIVSIFRSSPIRLPFAIKVIECHPLGSQAFMPLNGRAYIVVVAPAGQFNSRQLRAFQATGNQGINFHKGTWHHYNLALEAESSFLVIDRDGPGRNLEEVAVAQSIVLSM